MDIIQFKDCQYCTRSGKCYYLPQVLVQTNAEKCNLLIDKREKEDKTDVQEDIGY